MDVSESEVGGAAAGPNWAEGFPEASYEQWRGLVAGVLRKSGVAEERLADAPESVLATPTYDGFDIAPLYTGSTRESDPGLPGQAPFVRGYRPGGHGHHGWDVRARHTDTDPAVLRRRLHDDLINGVSSLWITVGSARAPGVAASALSEVLADVHLDLAPVVVDAGSDYADAARALLTAHQDAGVPDGRIISHLGIDPLTTAARAGERPEVAGPVRFAAEHAAGRPGLGLVVADGTLVHDAGGSEAQEIGFAVAAGTAYLRALSEAGLDLADAARRIEFRLAANADQFAVIAKLRAVRGMWNQVLQTCGVPARDRVMRVHAATSQAMMTRRDAHVNMLRTTVACFAAGVGGADAVTVAPFDSAVGVSDDFARRIARNTQSLLVEEAHLAQVIDPAGGSFYAESLTGDLYRAGWAFFQEVEAAGGAADALGSGMLADRVDQVWERRRRDLAHRRAPLTGVSEFPHLDEPPLPRPAAPALGAPGGFPVRRYAQEFEALRDRADAQTGDTGHRPTVFLATLGPVAAHTARASFAVNLLAAGGIAVHEPGPLEGAAEAAEAFAASGSRIAVICSSDAVYAEAAEAVARALKGAGARRVLLAGSPRDAYREAGVDAFAHRGCDAVALLTDLADVMLTDPAHPSPAIARGGSTGVGLPPSTDASGADSSGFSERASS
ncbi:heterodimeric methylmalonyl-CoA mutase small subunit [Nocardiopsis sp. Huas11]|uniref:methylmalonyl-CoA mutase family protein n=1 Tax=Nocardiopsis sp. Huas11 TaxID=2183912 RepID=UPI000EB02D7A|nr:methylmalonyl-CoA mutase family protein [Nocardiopsis sp. Huas11]RKS06171.1 heterodimeric methylmalonyl-CoA mutase small subunit [Nocardiopsis sp. Huas11]